MSSISNLEDGTKNPLDGRIGVNDSIVKIDEHTLDGFDNLKDMIDLIKTPSDNYPIRIVFRESCAAKNAPVLF